MAFGSITLWQIEGETVEAVTNFIFLGSKITVGDDLAMKLKDVLWKENYDKPRCILKSRDVSLLIKIHIVKAMVFPAVMYRCESWRTEELILLICGAGEDSCESLGLQENQTS